MTTPEPRTAALPRYQFYVTHCVKTDSVLNDPGWSVRAASTHVQAEVLQGLDYPPYELPMELWSKLPPRNQAPRRLARIPGPGSSRWVIHSSYLEKDTMNRDRSYFTHSYLLPTEETQPVAVLESWGARDWTTQYSIGATRDLKMPRSLPRGSLIGPEALAAFLSDTGVSPDADLATLICPPRLHTDGNDRRELAGRFLAAVMAITNVAKSPDETVSRRGRLFVHAEPGLLAMLLYAAVKLLPPGWVSDLSFSTFEPAHRGLREYKRALIVGTYLGNEAKSLEPDLFTQRGHGLDTFDFARSSELIRSEDPGILREIVRLAAERNWDLIRKIHGVLRDGRPDKAQISAVLGGQLAGTALDISDPREWERQWTSVRSLSDAASTKITLASILDDRKDRWGSASPAVRASVRRECAVLGMEPPQALLMPTGPEDLQDLLGRESTPEFRATAAFNIVHGGRGGWLPPSAQSHLATMKNIVRDHLKDTNDPTAGLYLRQAWDKAKTDFPFYLGFLFDPGEHAALPMLDKLVANDRRNLGPEIWDAIAEYLKLFTQSTWEKSLLEHNRLHRLLAVMGSATSAQKAWENYLGRIDKDMFIGDEAQKTIYEQLRHALDKLGNAAVVPSFATRKLTAVKTLMAACEGTDSPSKIEAGTLRHMFDWFWLNTNEGLCDLLGRCFLNVDPGSPKFEPFLNLFRACYPHGNSEADCTRVLSDLIEVTKDLDSKAQANVQVHYIQKYVPAKLWNQVLNVPREKHFARGVKQRIRNEAPPPSSKKWYFIGGGAAVAIALALVVFLLKGNKADTNAPDSVFVQAKQGSRVNSEPEPTPKTPISTTEEPHPSGPDGGPPPPTGPNNPASKGKNPEKGSEPPPAAPPLVPPSPMETPEPAPVPKPPKPTLEPGAQAKEPPPAGTVATPMPISKPPATTTVKIPSDPAVTDQKKKWNVPIENHSVVLIKNSDTLSQLGRFDTPADPNQKKKSDEPTVFAANPVEYWFAIAYDETTEYKKEQKTSQKPFIQRWSETNGPLQRHPKLNDHSEKISCLAFSLDGTRLLSGDSKGNCRNWNWGTWNSDKFDLTADNKPQGEASLTVNCIAYSAKSKRLVCGRQDASVYVWKDAPPRNQPDPVQFKLGKHNKPVLAVAFNLDGKNIASGDDGGTIKIWDHMNDGSKKPLLTLREETSAVRSLTFSPDGAKLISNHKSGAIYVWDVASGKIDVSIGNGKSKAKYFGVMVNDKNNTIRLFTREPLERETIDHQVVGLNIVTINNLPNSELNTYVCANGKRFMIQTSKKTFELWGYDK